MTTHKEKFYGLKADRLLQIRRIESLRELVLPVFPIAPLSVAPPYSTKPGDDAASNYVVALQAAFAQLEKSVEEVCGPAPWIVRSSGNEDLADLVNAGGYESLICYEPEALIQCVAAVALSGSTEHARRQLALSERYDHPEPIPCFVQPLLDINVLNKIGHDHSPYLDAAVLARMEAIGSELMQMFDFVAIDCEWGLETSLGFVSATTVMPVNPQQMNTAHTLGFGFSSAQNTGSQSTSLALRPASSDLRLWRGRHLRETTVQRLHLLQVRPAYCDDAFRDREVLTDACREALVGQYDAVQASLLLLGGQTSGRALVAVDLMNAWRRYLALSTREQADIAVVIVDEGSAQEHAGIMFRQQNITCISMETRRIPATADCVVFDRGLCIFGDSTMLRSVKSEPRRELVLPDGCALVFTDEVLGPDGELLPYGVEALSRLRRLPIAGEDKQRLMAYTEQPLPTRWLQRANDVVESPSLLGAILRSNTLAFVAKRPELTEFAKNYERATQISKSLLQHEPHILIALSFQARGLAGSADLRIVMALLDCGSAASWVPPHTLRRLIDSAALQLAKQQCDNAVLILESIAFVSKQCAQLPIYEPDETVSYLNALAHDLGGGLSLDVLRSIRSLELPISSEVLLARQTLQSPDMFESVNVFRKTIASFRGILSGGDMSEQLPAQLNDAWLVLRNSLCDRGLDHIAAQIEGSLIETYDASLKALLARTVDECHFDTYRCYLKVMQGWIRFIALKQLPERDTTVLEYFQRWLCQWADETIVDSFEIQDRNWRFEFDSMFTHCGVPPRYENPHVLHNLLHQYALAELQLETLLLPKRIQTLEHFCSTFSSRSTKVLRFEQALLEIQIPMGTHKVSYVFTPRLISVEWTEPPDCSGAEIARILAFEVLLDRLRTWMFPGLTFRREHVLGTWTLNIRLSPPTSDPWEYDQLRHFVVATRLLFDASYDFSYVANEVVDDFAEHFHGLEWKAIIVALIRHRALIEDASQYVALHALPMSSTIAAIARSRVVRGLLLRCFRKGFAYCRGLIDTYSYWLNDASGNNTLWSNRYEYLRQASLFLAVMWPREALLELAGRATFNVGDDLIAACLFKRVDLADDLRQMATAGSSTLSGMLWMIVRHAPEMAVQSCGASPLAAQLIGTGGRFRRAKHFLVARFGNHLGPELLTGILGDLDTVPWGATADIEQAIQMQLSMHQPVCRFELEKGIDWTALGKR